MNKNDKLIKIDREKLYSFKHLSGYIKEPEKEWVLITWNIQKYVKMEDFVTMTKGDF